MAHTRSTIKRIKQDRKKRYRNMAVRSSVKTVIKKFHSAVEEGDKKAAKEMLREAFSSLDTAVIKGVMKKNTASRRKSRLALQAAKLA